MELIISQVCRGKVNLRPSAVSALGDTVAACCGPHATGRQHARKISRDCFAALSVAREHQSL